MSDEREGTAADFARMLARAQEPHEDVTPDVEPSDAEPEDFLTALFRRKADANRALVDALHPPEDDAV